MSHLKGSVLRRYCLFDVARRMHALLQQDSVASCTCIRNWSGMAHLLLWCRSGVNWNLDNALPQGTILLDGVSILFENSYFANLQEYGDASIIFQDSTVAFQNATFVGNTQATAGAIFANNTVLSIDNSNFTNNYGFQSGAIQLLGSDSMMYINGTTFLNNTGTSCSVHSLVWSVQITTTTKQGHNLQIHQTHVRCVIQLQVSENQ